MDHQAMAGCALCSKFIAFCKKNIKISMDGKNGGFVWTEKRQQDRRLKL